MTPAQRKARTDRLIAERVAAGKTPTITAPAVYALLDAVLASSSSKAVS
jgi:hypothetical protein